MTRDHAWPSNTYAELVELLSDDGTVVGTHPKATVHSRDTPLHRAFSLYLRDDNGRILLTRRALGKAAWPGVWTNTCCGHPAPGETDEQAIARRLTTELGLLAGTVTMPRVVLPNFRYRAVDASGIVENEICPVYVADLLIRADQLSPPDPAEVMDLAWASWREARAALKATPFAFSPWCVLQTQDVWLDRALG